jgi:predicted DNA-binding ribbon-helix-helix protein
VFGRSGETSTSVQYLREAVTLAEANNLASHAVLSCGRLAEHHAHALEFRHAHAWRVKATEWLRCSEQPAFSENARRLAAKLALLEGRFDDATAALTETVDDILALPDMYRRCECAALHLHNQLARGEEPSARLLREFLHAFDAVKSRGEQDYPAHVRYLFEARTDAANARSNLRTYVANHRREQGAVPLLLADVIGEQTDQR